MANRIVMNSMSQRESLALDSKLRGTETRMSDMQDVPLELTSERITSVYNSVALAADMTEQMTRPVVQMVEQMAPYVRVMALATEQLTPYVRTVALATERLTPYVRTAALATEQLTPYVRTAALAAKSTEPFLGMIAQAAVHIESAINSQSWETTVQKGSGLNPRVASTTSEMAETKLGQFVQKHESLDSPLFRPSDLGSQDYDISNRSVVTDQVPWIGHRASLVGGTDTLEYRLAHLDAGFPRMLRGARAALNTPNPDRARHVIVSLRELVTHVLHRLAPDETIQGWNGQPDLYHGGRPTRRARLLYIFRVISTGTLSESVKSHVDWMISLIDILNGETHKVSSRLSDEELWALIAGTESLLHYILGSSSYYQTNTTEIM